jgi:hypothetical protein
LASGGSFNGYCKKVNSKIQDEDTAFKKNIILKNKQFLGKRCFE